MSYQYRETVDEIVIDKGIATREMWLTYPDGEEFVDYAELEQAIELRNRLPVVLDTDHNHQEPLKDASKAIGYVELRPCPEKKGVATTYHLRKPRLPPWLLDTIHRRAPIPISVFKYRRLSEDKRQRAVLLDHIAILTESEPRCPLPRCGVGVYDSQMSDKKESESKPEEKPVSKPVSEKPSMSEKPTKAEVPAQPPIAPPSAPEVLPSHVSQEIEALKAQLKAKTLELDAIRQPLVEELTNRGFAPDELKPLGPDSLKRMVDLAHQAQTQGLPGTVPKPPVIPKTRAEAREEAFEKAVKEDRERQAKRWAGM